MDAKTQKLYRFYIECKNKGYDNPLDDTQALKMKVIAVDNGIKYKNIEKTYSEAKALYLSVEREREDKLKEEKNRADQLAINGILIISFVILGKPNKIVELYRRADGSLYFEINGKRIDGAPKFNVYSGKTLSYTYHPSKTIFTGASSGSIAMGGFHQTEAYYSEKVNKSSKGYIKLEYGSEKLQLDEIWFEECAVEPFKRSTIYKSLELDKSMCVLAYDKKGEANSKYILNNMNMPVSSMGSSAGLSSMSTLINNRYLPMKRCIEILNFVNDVITENYPESDESKYERACKLADSNKSNDLKCAINLFTEIFDYSDAREKLAIVKKKYEGVLQSEKENKIIRHEKNSAIRRRVLIITIPILLLIIISVYLVTMITKKTTEERNNENTYLEAIALLEEKNYEESRQKFSEIDNYKDSEDYLHECDYREALDYKDVNYDKALVLFHKLGEYKDSAQLYTDVLSNKNSVHFANAKLYIDQEKYDDALKELNSIDIQNDEDRALLSEYKNQANCEIEREKKYDEIKDLLKEGYMPEAYKELQELPNDYKKVSELTGICEDLSVYCGAWESTNYRYDSEGEIGMERHVLASLSIYVDEETLNVLALFAGHGLNTLEGHVFHDYQNLDTYYDAYFNMDTGEFQWAYDDSKLTGKFRFKYYDANETVVEYSKSGI